MRLMWCLLIAAAISINSQACSVAAGSAIRSMTLKSSDFDSLDGPLHIIRKSGEISFNGNESSYSLEIEYFKGGKKSDFQFKRTSISALTTNDIARFAIHVVDTDYLRLGDSKPKHSRVFVRLESQTTSPPYQSAGTSTFTDIPKSVCDFSKLESSGAFRDNSLVDGRMPLLWMIGNTDSVSDARTPEEFVRINSKGDIAIVYLRVGK